MRAIFEYQYKKYIVNLSDAVKILEILEKAERYKAEYRESKNGGTLHYAWTQPNNEMGSVELMPDDLYRLARMAGDPSKD